MSDADPFEQHRAHLTGLAYRMLGEIAAAEDVVQDAWLRWNAADRASIRDARAWLSTVTIRIALDALRSARARRETYVGPWIPEPVLPDDVRAFAADALAAQAELASDLSLALMFVLQRLSPEECAAFILHDAFDCDYEAIAATLGKTETACRKLVSRARERVRQDRPRHSVSREQHGALLSRFIEAATKQDGDALAKLFAPDVIFYSDGGGRVPAALNPVYGSDRVQRLILGLMRKSYGRGVTHFGVAEIGGRPGFVSAGDDGPYSALDIETDGERITAIFVLRNPEKLARIARVLMPSSGGSSPSA